MGVLTLKIKLPVISPAKVALFWSKPAGAHAAFRKPGKEAEAAFRGGGEGGVGGAVVNQKSIGVNWELEV